MSPLSLLATHKPETALQATNSETPFFLVIEDHPEVGQNNCEFLRIMSPQCSCISVDTPQKGVEQLRQGIPDLVVVDLQFGTVGGEQSAKPGLELLKQIFEYYPTVNILVYTSEPTFLRQLIPQISKYQGGFAVVNKMERRSAFLEGARCAIEGQLKVHRELMKEMQLSQQDLEILDLLCNHALTDRAIAERMHVSLKTAQNYVQRLKVKLDIEHLDDGQNVNPRVAICMTAMGRKLVVC
ncbi:response regulator transcription factor [Aliterella atlantica]|uniref:response regulator transcription factor n=1 Tax=Aliterella atlantica TaxID=1827278 RepID=UPI00069717C6|nr:response regulator transcription factor [Aliterella atlantica]